MDITEHRTGEGKVYLAAVLDAYSRRVVGWSIADHIRSELVVDALQMAVWRRQPAEGQTIAHSDHGSQYTSWAFGRRLRAAGLLGSIGDCFDNSVAESFFGSLQLELLDEHRSVQLLTMSSQIKNPLTSAGRMVDIGLEIWALFVVTAVAGSFATFFSSGDASS